MALYVLATFTSNNGMGSCYFSTDAGNVCTMFNGSPCFVHAFAAGPGNLLVFSHRRRAPFVYNPMTLFRPSLCLIQTPQISLFQIYCPGSVIDSLHDCLPCK